MAKKQTENNAKPLPAAKHAIKSTGKKPTATELAAWRARFDGSWLVGELLAERHAALIAKSQLDQG